MSQDSLSNASGDAQFLDHFPPTPPVSTLLWTAIVDVDDTTDLGASAQGTRFIVPILGGRFFAADAETGLSGRVLSGGADRQLLRPDGVKELEAIYEMETGDGTILSIRNNVTVDLNMRPERYAMSVIQVSAPDGPFAWLGRRVILGTLQSARPAVNKVIIRAWLMETGPR